MRIELLFPIILIILDFCASAVYLWQSDYRLALYWLFAGGLSICVVIK